MKLFRKILLVLLVILAGFSVMSNAQGRRSSKKNNKEKDSFVYLLSSKSAQTIVINGVSYRKIIGPARFLHNGTYLLCDTALWNVNTKVIDAWGHVRILQDETVLSSDKLIYLVDKDLAQFRGTVVQLTDKDRNTLRTRHLDYNTADSIAVFQNGGSMKDKDGQIIESRNGTYDSKKKVFTFENDVNMFSDSIFVKTRTLVYESKKDLATFSSVTDVWKDDNMLTADQGWYDKGREIFFFRNNVHVMTEDQEGWCDSLYFYRSVTNVEMLGNAQITDTTRNVFALAGRIEYVDSLSQITMTRKPAVISEIQNEDESLDTVYLGAAKLVYYSQKRCDVDSLVALDAEKRVEAMNVDPVGEYRKKAAQEAAKAAEEAAKNDPNYRPQNAKGRSALSSQNTPLAANKPAPEQVADSLATTDSVSVADTVAVLPPKDTTKIGFLTAVRNVKLYRKDMQIVCDSLLFCDLDSLARFFKEPIIWQEEKKQYTADSIYVLVKNGAMDKASLMANAFISIQEDPKHYDQIKGTEMLAFFNADGQLIRFDVLGGASALFYIEENDTFATVNKPESKMLSALLEDGQVQRIYYYDQAKNDGYPIVQLSEDEQRLKGFVWNPEKRPTDRTAVTPLALRPSQRRMYNARPKAAYMQTDIYFPGYMKGVYKQIEEREALKRERELERQLAEERGESEIGSISEQIQNLEAMPVEEVNTVADSLSTKEPMIGLSDSLAVADTVAKVLTPEEIKAAEKAAKEKAKAEKKAAKEQKAKEKQEALEAKWAEMDRRDAEKAAAKEEQRLEKERNRKRKALENAAKKAQREAELLEKYQRRYRNRKNRSN